MKKKDIKIGAKVLVKYNNKLPSDLGIVDFKLDTAIIVEHFKYDQNCVKLEFANGYIGYFNISDLELIEINSEE